jgi:hypothetical protein
MLNGALQLVNNAIQLVNKAGVTKMVYMSIGFCEKENAEDTVILIGVL